MNHCCEGRSIGAWSWSANRSLIASAIGARRSACAYAAVILAGESPIQGPDSTRPASTAASTSLPNGISPIRSTAADTAAGSAIGDVMDHPWPPSRQPASRTASHDTPNGEDRTASTKPSTTVTTARYTRATGHEPARWDTSRYTKE